MRTALTFGALLAFLLLVGCTLVTEALRATGIIPADGGMMEAAKAVDYAIGGWVHDLIWGSGSIGAWEASRHTIRAVKARKAKKALVAPVEHKR
jgi:hypothetical protein